MQTLQPTSKAHDVPNRSDERIGEFEVQATLFNKLRALGVKVRGEVKWRNKDTRETCRFDLVIYENGRAVEIVEVKSAPVQHKAGVEATRQCKRYRTFGIPVTFVYGMEDAERFVSLWELKDAETCGPNK